MVKGDRPGDPHPSRLIDGVCRGCPCGECPAFVIQPSDPAPWERWFLSPVPRSRGELDPPWCLLVSFSVTDSEHAPALDGIGSCIQPKHRGFGGQRVKERGGVDPCIDPSSTQQERGAHPLSVGLNISRIVVLVDDLLLWLLDAVQSVDPWVRALIAGVAVLLETSVLVGLIVPGDTIVIIASMGVGAPWEAVVLGLFVVVGSLIGESIGFALGRWLGPRIRSSWVGRRIGERQWERADNYLRRRGGVAIFLSRFLPVLHSLVPLTVGMSNFSYRRFLAWTAPACVLWAAAYVTVTSLAAGSFRELVDQVHFAGYIFVGIIVAFLLLVLLGKKLLSYWESRHMRAVDTGADEQAPEGMKD